MNSKEEYELMLDREAVQEFKFTLMRQLRTLASYILIPTGLLGFSVGLLGALAMLVGLVEDGYTFAALGGRLLMFSVMAAVGLMAFLLGMGIVDAYAYNTIMPGVPDIYCPKCKKLLVQRGKMFSCNHCGKLLPAGFKIWATRAWSTMITALNILIMILLLLFCL